MANDEKALVWDRDGERLYETGVEKAALFVWNDNGNNYGNGVAWNGLISVSESPSGAEATPIYANDGKYLNLISKEDFGATIEAYTYPKEFMECDGTKAIVAGVYVGQQTRKKFGLAYETLIGSDTLGTDKGRKMHLVYGCTATPSEKGYSTVNESPEAITFSWTLNTVPIDFVLDTTTGKTGKTAIITIDSTVVGDEKFKLLEEYVYGRNAVAADAQNNIEAVTAQDPTLPTVEWLRTNMATSA